MVYKVPERNRLSLQIGVPDHIGLATGDTTIIWSLTTRQPVTNSIIEMC